MHLFVNVLMSLAEIKRHLFSVQGIIFHVTLDKLELHYILGSVATYVALKTRIIVYPAFSHTTQWLIKEFMPSCPFKQKKLIIVSVPLNEKW